MTVNEARIFTKNNQFLIQDEIKNIVEKIWSTEYCTLHSVPIYYREVDDQLYCLCIIFDDFYFSQILTGIVQKQHALIPFNFF